MYQMPDERIEKAIEAVELCKRLMPSKQWEVAGDPVHEALTLIDKEAAE